MNELAWRKPKSGSVLEMLSFYTMLSIHPNLLKPEDQQTQKFILKATGHELRTDGAMEAPEQLVRELSGESGVWAEDSLGKGYLNLCLNRIDRMHSRLQGIESISSFVMVPPACEKILLDTSYLLSLFSFNLWYASNYPEQARDFLINPDM